MRALSWSKPASSGVGEVTGEARTRRKREMNSCVVWNSCVAWKLGKLKRLREWCRAGIPRGGSVDVACRLVQ